MKQELISHSDYLSSTSGQGDPLCVVTQVHTLQFRRSLQPGGDSWRVKYQLLYALSSMLHAHQPELAMSAPSHCQKAAECGDVATLFVSATEDTNKDMEEGRSNVLFTGLIVVPAIRRC